MTLQFAAGICSLTGAFLFFGAGFFFAKHRLTLDKGKLEDEIAAVEQRETTFREKAIQDNLSFKRNIDMLKQKNDAYQKATQKRMAELKRRVADLNSILGDYKERLSDLAVEVTRADADNVLLIEALDNAKRDQVETAAFEQKNKELSRELEILKKRLKDTDGLKDEDQKTAVRVAERDALTANNTNVGKTAVPSPDSLSSEVSSAREGLGKAFQSIVNQMSKLEGSQGVVVADELGLLIAGSGEHMDSMAGMAAVYSEVDGKVASLIPFGDIDVIKIRNLENLTVTMQPFSIDSEKLILTTLTTGAGPDRETLTQLTEQAITT